MKKQNTLMRGLTLKMGGMDGTNFGHGVDFYMLEDRKIYKSNRSSTIIYKA